MFLSTFFHIFIVCNTLRVYSPSLQRVGVSISWNVCILSRCMFPAYLTVWSWCSVFFLKFGFLGCDSGLKNEHLQINELSSVRYLVLFDYRKLSNARYVIIAVRVDIVHIGHSLSISWTLDRCHRSSETALGVYVQGTLSSL